MTWACDPALAATVTNTYHVAGPLLGQALVSFLAAQCSLAGEHLWPADATHQVLQDPNYDFIVVGAGSAGSVIANRLSEVAHWKVLLVEAGGDPTLTTEIPQLFYNNMNSEHDWKFKTEPQPGACRSYKRKGCAWPRGKTLGGCSSANFMFYVRGNKADYDEWADLGNPGWSYNDVLPYFKKSENFTEPLTKEFARFHNTGGYLNIEEGPSHPFEEMIIKAAVELGLNRSIDLNGASQMGVRRSFTTTFNGVRQSTARTFLSPIRFRNNLHVIKFAEATKLLFHPDSNEISGVSLRKNGRDIIVNARKEVIVSAGAIKSPHLLMHSGVGPKNHLEAMGIEVKADLPVGENLLDHLYVPIYYTLPGKNTLKSAANILKIFADYLFTRKGPLGTTSPHKVTAFVNTTDPQSDISDIQYHYIVLPPGFCNLVDLYENHEVSEEYHKKICDIGKDNFVLSIYVTLLRPQSKGRILLKNPDPIAHPLIYANYFENPEDMKTILRGIKQHALKLGNTKALKDAGFQLKWVDLDACKQFEKESDEHLECISREMTFSLYHPVGTVKMGPDYDDAAVVDSRLKVRKVKGLRVADASIMPTIVRGNTNAPTIMIGENVADFIKKDWNIDCATNLEINNYLQ